MNCCIGVNKHMSKLFFDVFPDLRVPSEMEHLLAEVEVTKVSTNRQRDRLRVYLLSSRLIEKNRIFRLEKDIKKQLFPNHELSVKIIEKFRLSGQYNPQKLMMVYRDSLLEEFRTYSLLEYSMLKTSKMEFPEDRKLMLTLEDSVVARQKSEEMVQILEKIICERCGLDVDIQIHYKELAEKKHRQNSDLLIQNEVHTIISNSSIGKTDSENMISETENNPAPKEGGQALEGAPFTPDSVLLAGSIQETMPPPKQTDNHSKRGFSGNRGRGGFSGGSFKRSDNPDVVYGRDFEEDAVAIDQIAGEMGEVVIKGKILNLETREIRNEKTIIMFSVTDFTDTIMVKMFAKNEYVPEITKEYF